MDLCGDAVRAATAALENELWGFQYMDADKKATRVLEAAQPFLAQQILRKLEIKLENAGQWTAAMMVADEMGEYPID
jgi:hypothetical protein